MILKRKIPLMFFVGMVFLYFPLYYAQYSPNPMAVILATILFAWSIVLSFTPTTSSIPCWAGFT